LLPEGFDDFRAHGRHQKIVGEREEALEAEQQKDPTGRKTKLLFFSKEVIDRGLDEQAIEPLIDDKRNRNDWQ
jgi:hypothetical protein